MPLFFWLIITYQKKHCQYSGHKDCVKKKTDYEEALKQKELIEKGYIEFKHKVGEASKLFGSITEKEIADQMNKKFNLNIDKKRIVIAHPIKNLGDYTVSIKLNEGVVASLKIVVVRM